MQPRLLIENVKGHLTFIGFKKVQTDKKANLFERSDVLIEVSDPIDQDISGHIHIYSNKHKGLSLSCALGTDDSGEVSNESACFFSSNNSVEFYLSQMKGDLKKRSEDNFIVFFDEVLAFFERSLSLRDFFENIQKTYSKSAIKVENLFPEIDYEVIEEIVFYYSSDHKHTIRVKWIGSSINRPKYDYGQCECFIDRIEVLNH
jgi:hypothetical protein